MFELSIALKYLIPKKKQLSVSLIALMAVAVISLVVWLVLIFLSVTEGIERNWLTKLTTLNAPLRITPTDAYYNSYYYRIDALSSASNYTAKSIAQKRASPHADPFQPEEDEALPSHFPLPEFHSNGTLIDPVVQLYRILNELKGQQKDLAFQDFELSGALLRLQLLRPGAFPRFENTQSYLTQVSYLATFPEKCPRLESLLISPSEKDVNHLLYLAGHTTELSRQDAPALTLKADASAKVQRVQNVLRAFKIEQLKPKYSLWQMPPTLLPEQKPLRAFAFFHGDHPARIDIPMDAHTPCPSDAREGKLRRAQGQILFEQEGNRVLPLSFSTPLLLQGAVTLDVAEPPTINGEGNLLFQVKIALQKTFLQGTIHGEGLEAAKTSASSTYVRKGLNEESETGVYLAKSYQENGVFLGDRGYLSYSSTTTSSVQEHRLPIFVAGFYDPGLLSVGNKCILVPPHVTETINASNSAFNLDKTQANGIMVWFADIHNADLFKQKITAALKSEGLDAYWKVSTFKEYDFAKDLMEQFQSDKYLFTLVGLIILLIACCNIISLLVLLVNDKKKEIGILQAMGCSRKSIALIFSTCGIAMGVISSILGTCAAIVTLKYIDSLVSLLSMVQGHDAFNATFFGKTLPNTLSHDALLFVLIATPCVALLAGFVPAVKACRLRPSEILRSE